LIPTLLRNRRRTTKKTAAFSIDSSHPPSMSGLHGSGVRIRMLQLPNGHHDHKRYVAQPPTRWSLPQEFAGTPQLAQIELSLPACSGADGAGHVPYFAGTNFDPSHGQNGRAVFGYLRPQAGHFAVTGPNVPVNHRTSNQIVPRTKKISTRVSNCITHINGPLPDIKSRASRRITRTPMTARKAIAENGVR